MPQQQKNRDIIKNYKDEIIMEKVLVTGATGYIGLHCIHQLLNQGYAVNGTVRSPDRKREIYDALQKHRTPTDLSLIHI